LYFLYFVAFVLGQQKGRHFGNHLLIVVGR